MDVDDFGGWEFEFDDGDTCGFEVGEETNFGWLKEEKGAAFSVVASSCSSYTVDVIGWVIGRIELDNPVYIRDLLRKN